MLTTDLDVLDVDSDFERVNDTLYERGMTDGLPVVPPTRARVEAMIAGARRDPAESLGAFPPAYNEATIGKLAVNATMAGCRPEYMPVLIAAIEAMLDPAFNLYGINATTHPVSPLIIINGPIVRELKVNFGYNVLGQGWRANATIGRATRLAMINMGGGRPGTGDMATHGHPGKYSYCMAENEAKSPWEPLHVRRGFSASDSTVTVFGAEAPHEVNDHTSVTGAGIMTTQAHTFATLGNNHAYLTAGEFCLVMGPEHAETIARDGWSIPQVQQYLFGKARLKLGTLRAVGKAAKLVTKHFNPLDDDEMIPLTMSPDDIMILVAGGAGKHSMAIPSFGMTRSITRLVKAN
jgi:hypothetical protein